MSALLDAVEIARERRDAAEQAFRETVRRARESHSLAQIGRAAGMTKNGVRWITGEDERSRKGRDE